MMIKNYAIKVYTISIFTIGSLFINFTVDDAFISFRYGKNLIEHGIWNWNPTKSELVEAYTNPIYAGLSIIPHWLNFNVIILYKLIGIILLYLTFYVLSKKLDKNYKWLCAAFMATNILIFPHAFSGLETISFFLAAFYLMTLDDEQAHSALSSWMILLAPLIRPEGALLSLYILFRQMAHKKRLSIYAIVALGVGLSYFLARYSYFEYIFPNTFYAKEGNGFATLIGNFVGEKVVISGWLISLVLIAKHNGKFLLPLILFAGYLFGNLTADLQMNYGNRFAWHMLFPAIFYSFWLAIRSVKYQSSDAIRVTLPILFIVAFVTNFGGNLWWLLTYYPDAIRSHRALGQSLFKYQKYEPILAVVDAGLIPYYSNLHTIDYVGLANSEVAHAIEEKREPILKTPDILALMSEKENSCAPGNIQFKGEKTLRGIIPGDLYECVSGPRWGNNYYVNFLIRKDLEFFPNLVSDIGAIKNNSNGKTNLEQIKDVLTFSGLR